MKKIYSNKAIETANLFINAYTPYSSARAQVIELAKTLKSEEFYKEVRELIVDSLKVLKNEKGQRIVTDESIKQYCYLIRKTAGFSKKIDNSKKRKKHEEKAKEESKKTGKTGETGEKADTGDSSNPMDFSDLKNLEKAIVASLSAQSESDVFEAISFAFIKAGKDLPALIIAKAEKARKAVKK